MEPEPEPEPEPTSDAFLRVVVATLRDENPGMGVKKLVGLTKKHSTALASVGAREIRQAMKDNDDLGAPAAMAVLSAMLKQAHADGAETELVMFRGQIRAAGRAKQTRQLNLFNDPEVMCFPTGTREK